jgi:hypothetical protein
VVNFGGSGLSALASSGLTSATGFADAGVPGGCTVGLAACEICVGSGVGGAGCGLGGFDVGKGVDGGAAGATSTTGGSPARCRVGVGGGAVGAGGGTTWITGAAGPVATTCSASNAGSGDASLTVGSGVGSGVGAPGARSCCGATRVGGKPAIWLTAAGRGTTSGWGSGVGVASTAGGSIHRAASVMPMPASTVAKTSRVPARIAVLPVCPRRITRP